MRRHMAKQGVYRENKASASYAQNKKFTNRTHERTVASKQTDFILKNPHSGYDV